MEFGPEIKVVDGKRPEWLGAEEQIMLKCHDKIPEGQWFGDGSAWYAFEIYNGFKVSAIRLPVNHSHYAAPTPDERAVAPELVERMRKLIETMASCDGAAFVLEYKDEARAIVAALEPVDPDVIEAEAIMKTIGYRDIDPASDVLKVAVTALRRGRALASRDVTPCTREQFEEDCRA